MAYNITKTNGQFLLSLGEAVVDTTYGISLIGQNYRNYGQLMANNFVRLLENQANDTPPTNALAGQLWFDTVNKTIHFFDGARFRQIARSSVEDTAPINPVTGDQWWDTSTKLFKIYDGTDWKQLVTLDKLYSHVNWVLPRYSIIVFSASKATPGGWVVCDGSNGTPNTTGLLPNTLKYIMKVS